MITDDVLLDALTQAGLVRDDAPMADQLATLLPFLVPTSKNALGVAQLSPEQVNATLVAMLGALARHHAADMEWLHSALDALNADRAELLARIVVLEAAVKVKPPK